MRKIEIYRVYINSDRTEGRGPMSPTDVAFINKADAIEYVKSPEYANKYGVMGTPGAHIVSILRL